MNITHIGKFNPTNNLRTLHSVTRLDSDTSTASNEQQAVSVSYPSIESYHNHLMYAAMQQQNIFGAIRLLSEAEQLNEGRSLSDYHYAQIKFHFISKDRDENRKNKSGEYKGESYSFSGNQNVKNEKTILQSDFIKNEIVKFKNRKTKSHFTENGSHIAQIELHNMKQPKMNRELLHRQMVEGYMGMLSSQPEMSKIEYRI